ncbi:MAG: type II CRISPR RNA-guided endonuclease Cas9, partial [Clostridia bacterium]|nr:type II CRISPR RNA-guided endonuclease Cas9 [Clostridia bacterium]
MENKKYYLGLDIGTDSVGYAATDEEYSLLKFHGRPEWGVTLFDEAQLGNGRRAARSARRRLDRRQQRVQLLRELFAKEIAKKDEKFYQRIDQSALFPEDRESEFAIFDDPNFNDKDYHKKYPTIHHLIYELMTSDKEHDVRLVYLACAWLVAHRGHFLSQINSDNIKEITDFKGVFAAFSEYFKQKGYIVPWKENCREEVEKALKAKKGKLDKFKELKNAMFEDGKVPKTPSDVSPEDFPFNTEIVLKALCGSQISAEKLFDNEEYKDVPSFSLDSDDEKLAEIITQLGDDGDIIPELKKVFDWSLLVN